MGGDYGNPLLTKGNSLWEDGWPDGGWGGEETSTCLAGECGLLAESSIESDAFTTWFKVFDCSAQLVGLGGLEQPLRLGGSARSAGRCVLFDGETCGGWVLSQ
jgi:hypothetical protein